ncbi:MAG: hypothetical protein Greene041662_994 [Candidatus Peregrinibacteria bacterium Greene0416_62]|nr:MAG: hypothetical protein Greene041662_994 [Candidatus Peregrinibacteria bacterium Greene0416_62]TSD00502.1 MAG: hypothetical protein Greene101449_112 [Candidatus Peregrinibacteria bacterium Greene1014_49]
MKRFSLLIGIFGGLLHSVAAYAALYPFADPCTYLGAARCGTNTAGVENLIKVAIESVATFLAVGGGALAVLYTVVGGLQMLLSFGDEGRFTRGRSSVTWALVGFGILLGSQMIVGFISDTADLATGAAAPLLTLMEVIVSSILDLLNVLFVIIIMAAGIRAIIGRGKQEEFTKAKHAIGFAIAGALIINLARALATATLKIFIP